ncbi:MAG TPA: hypothetical protein H9881_09020 [Candidatus Stackebrandtia excrementipullorum]|nr:hypothetical protein [Candidatus Stackebrandtia excrementipullorum]
MNALAHAAVRISALVVAGSLLMLAATGPGTAERIITIVSLTAGLLVAVATIVLSRYGRQALALIRRDKTDRSSRRTVSPQEEQ